MSTPMFPHGARPRVAGVGVSRDLDAIVTFLDDPA
jgi:hypothetical protein